MTSSMTGPKHYSPRMIVAQENLDHDRHCKYACGDYVQAHEEPLRSNTNAARSLDCLYLRPTAKSQNGHDLLHLQANKIITRRNITLVSITPSIINQVHKLAEMEHMPKGLNVYNRTGLILFDSASIAGVDIQEVTDEEDEDESSSEEDEETDNVDENELADVLQQPALTTSDNNNVNADDNNVEEEKEEEEDSDEDGVDEDSDDNSVEEENEDEEIHQPDNNNNNVEEVAEELPQPPALRRSSRASKSNHDSIYSYLQAREENIEEYSVENAPVIATIMCQIYEKMAAMSREEAFSFIQTYSLKAGIKKFGERGSEAATKEIKQLHDRKVFKPIMSSELTTQERKRAMDSLIFFTEKRDGRVKGRACANGSTQRDYIPREDAASPTASTDSVLITGVIEANQHRDIMTLDIPNAFVQTPIPQGDERVIMKIRGVLVDILCQLAPEVYRPYVVEERNNKLL